MWMMIKEVDRVRVKSKAGEEKKVGFNTGRVQDEGDNLDDI
jgi:hypothetical protein